MRFTEFDPRGYNPSLPAAGRRRTWTDELNMRRLFQFLKRPAVPFWGTISALTLYVLSLGPASLLWGYVELPEWAAATIQFFYLPILWVIEKSDFAASLWIWYLSLWWDFGNDPATKYHSARNDSPPFFVEVSGALLSAWLIWSFVHWMNRRRGHRDRAVHRTVEAAP